GEKGVVRNFLGRSGSTSCQVRASFQCLMRKSVIAVKRSDESIPLEIDWLVGSRLLHFLAPGNNRGLDLAAALHELLEDAIELVQVRVAGDEGLGLEAAAGNECERLAAD